MITRRRTLAAIAAAIAAPFVSKEAAAAPPSPPGRRPPPRKPPMPIDVILYQNVDNDPVIQLINPDGTCPDVTKITSAKVTIKDVGYGTAILPDKTESGSGIVFATDASGAWVNTTIHYSPADMSSVLGSITQPKEGCPGNLNITVTIGGVSQIATVPLRVAVLPNATSGG